MCRNVEVKFSDKSFTRARNAADVPTSRGDDAEGAEWQN